MFKMVLKFGFCKITTFETLIDFIPFFSTAGHRANILVLQQNLVMKTGKKIVNFNFFMNGYKILKTVI